MATFTASPIVDPNVDTQGIQRNALSLAGQQQDLTDRQTFRDNAAGVVARDPAATGAALGANPGATIGYVGNTPALDANTRAQFATDQANTGALAGSVLNQPPDQRAAAYQQGIQALRAGGYKGTLPDTYPGDGAMLMARGQSLSTQEQLQFTPQPLSANPKPLLQSVPGGGSVGPGGAQASPDGSGQQSGAPSGFQADLAQRESSGNPAALNSAGYAGLYQFGTKRLAELGLYQPANGESLASNQWKGQLQIPGFPQVKTLADFQANPAAQNAAFTTHEADIDQTIAQTPGAQNFNQNGLRAVAHLGGAGGMARFVQTGGRFSPSDSNGTSLAAYYSRFSGGQPPGPATPPTQVAANTGTTGMPQTATDASPAPASPPAATVAPLPVTPSGGPQGSAAPQAQGARPAGFGANGDPAFTPAFGVAADQAAPSGQGDAQSIVVSGSQPAQQQFTITPAQATQQATADLAGKLNGLSPDDANQAVVQRAQAIMAGGSAQPAVASPAAQQQTPLAAPPPTANPLSAAALPAPQAPNSLSAVGNSAPASANALSSVGQPQPGSQGAPLPQAPQYPFARDYKTLGYLPVPGQEGFAYAIGPNGPVAQRIPGAPGTGVKTLVTPAGSIISTDNQTGQVVQNIPNGAPNSARLTTVDDGQGGKLILNSQGQTIAQTPSSVPMQLQTEDYKRDQNSLEDVVQQLNQAKQADFAIREQRGITSGLTQTGAFGERKATLANYLESTFSPDTAKAFEGAAGLDDASQSQLFAKVALQAAGQQENANVGARGGFGLTNLYLRANPGLQNQPNLIRNVQNLQAVSNLSQQDYLQGLLGYVNTNAAAFRNGETTKAGQAYSPATNFSQQWNGGNNPQVYVAAAEALNQVPFSKWSAGLSDGDKQRALSIAARADNTASYNGPQGRAALTPFGQPQQAAPAQAAQSPAAPAGQPAAPAGPAVGTISRGYRFSGGDPSNPASWARVQ